MFNPTITPGPWERICEVVYTDCDGVIDMCAGDRDAILSVPELLKIYHAVKRCIDDLVIENSFSADELRKAIESLEERNFK